MFTVKGIGVLGAPVGTDTLILFIITEKARAKERKWDSVGVMKDKELKLEDVKVPDTLGWASYILLVKFVNVNSTKEVVSLFEVELQKPRNLSAHESEECEHGEGVGVYATLLQSDTL
jgi:hypothetical protein